MQHPTCAAEHLPAKWRHEFISADIQQQSIGESRADVFLIRSANRPDRYLKSERIDAFSELPDETERLRWMAARPALSGRAGHRPGK